MNLLAFPAQSLTQEKNIQLDNRIPNLRDTSDQIEMTIQDTTSRGSSSLGGKALSDRSQEIVLIKPTSEVKLKHETEEVSFSNGLRKTFDPILDIPHDALIDLTNDFEDDENHPNKNVTPPDCQASSSGNNLPVSLRPESPQDMVAIQAFDQRTPRRRDSAPASLHVFNDFHQKVQNEDAYEVEPMNTNHSQIHSENEGESIVQNRNTRDQEEEVDLEDDNHIRTQPPGTKNVRFNQEAYAVNPSRHNSRHSPQYTSNFMSRRSAPASSRMNGDFPFNDIDVVHNILDGRFRRAQILEDELAQMQATVFDIDDKLKSFVDKEQEASRLRERCQLFQDAINEQRDKQTRLTDETEKLRFQLQVAHDEIKRTKSDMMHRLAREADKHHLSERIIKHLRVINETNKDQLVELDDGFKRLRTELADLLEERAALKIRVRERDVEFEKIRRDVLICQENLKSQRAKYQELLDKCVKADEITVTNKMLRINLENSRKDLDRERGVVLSLEAILKEMTLEIGILRDTITGHHDIFANKFNSTIETFRQLVSSQEVSFAQSREILIQIKSNCEDPSSGLFKTLESITTQSNSKWTSLNEVLSKLSNEQKKVSADYCEKVEKWKGLKVALTRQVDHLSKELNDQRDTIKVLSQEKACLNSEVERTKDLNQCLVQTSNREKELNEARMTEVNHKLELLEGTRREYLVKNSLLESNVKSLEMKLEAERKRFEAEQKLLDEANAKHREEVEQLRAECKQAESDLGVAEALRAKIEGTTKLSDELKSKILEEKNRVQEATARVSSLQNELRIKDEQLRLAASRWADLSAKQNRLEVEITAAKAEVQLRSEDAQSHIINTDLQATKISTLEEALDKKNEAIKRLELDMRSARAEVKDWAERFEIEQKMLDGARQLQKTLEEAIQERDNKNFALGKELEENRNKVYQLEIANSNKDKEIARLKLNLETANQKITKQKIGISVKKPTLAKGNQPTLTEERAAPLEKQPANASNSKDEQATKPTPRRSTRTNNLKKLKAERLGCPVGYKRFKDDKDWLFVCPLPSMSDLKLRQA
ncbi:hypothetical protein ABW20_dc0109519 [Dactylellina cionopaga]|nr:hypothetical protein ABW20_dc0109519 [Dactylellina cionopaga]